MLPVVGKGSVLSVVVHVDVIVISGFIVTSFVQMMNSVVAINLSEEG